MWKTLESRGTQFLRGQLVLVCAGPGTGKSAFILSYALRSTAPTLYFSADSDAFTQTSRAASVLAGWPMEQSKQAVREENLAEIEAQLDEIPVRFSYEASPSLDQIEDSMKAYYALYEDFPALVVIDNVTDVRTGFGGDAAEDPFSGLEPLMNYLHELARKTESCVIGLHHVKGEHNDGQKPIPLSGIKNQIGRVPEMILTLFKVSDDYGPSTLNVSTVKNRTGKMDPSGLDYVGLEFDGNTMQINDFVR